MSDYYVRSPEAEQADGPFSLEQLRELADSGILRPETLVYSEGMEDFVAFSERPELWESIRGPAKPSLRLKRKPVEGAEPGEGAETAGPTKKKKAAPPSADEGGESGDIGRMLAAAEGKTEQTRYVQRLRKSRERAVAILLPGLVLMLFASVAVVVRPQWEEIYGMIRSADYSFDLLLGNWILLFAIVDFALAIGIGLGQTALFGLLRFRAGFGLGFFLFLFYSRQEWEALAAVEALQLGMIGATLCARFFSTLLFVLLGLAGGGFLVWLAWFGGLSL
mgnify:CR=1 FL=1